MAIKCAVINARDFFDKGNNPSGRMDASYGIMLATVLSGNIDLIAEQFTDMFTSKSNYKNWCLALRKMTFIREIEEHIAHAFASRSSLKKFSPNMRKVIHKVAIQLCRQQSEQAQQAQQEIEEIVKQIQSLRQLADTEEKQNE